MTNSSVWRRSLALAVTLLLAISGAALAQETGSLYGRVTDNNGERLPGVTVTLSGVGAAQVQVTEAEGEFRFIGLDPGTYKIEAALNGFSTVVYEAVSIRVGRSTTIELKLSPAIEETITVTTESPLLDERKISSGMQVTQLELQKIPSARDPWSLANQTPGVVMDRVNVGGSESGQQPNFVGLGSNSAQNVFMIDGVDITDQSAQGGSSTYFGFEQFEEMAFSTGGTDIEIQTPGVQISMVTRRGTNEWRGSGSYNLTDKETQAGDNLDRGDLPPGQTASGGELTGNSIDKITQWGVEAGGFVIKDRLWIWGSRDRNDINQQVFGGSIDNTKLNNDAAKLNAQITNSNSFIFTWNKGEKVKTGRDAGPTRPPETTFNQGGPSPLRKFEDTHVFNSNFFLTGSWSNMRGGFFLEPQGGRDTNNFYQDADGVYHGSYYFLETSRPSQQWKVDGSVFFATGKANHELKFGGRRRTADNSSLWGAPGNGVITYAGELFGLEPPTVLAYAWRLKDTRSQVRQEALWVQDTFTTDRLTVNVGLRMDNQDGFNKASAVPGSPFGNNLTAVDFPGNEPPFEWNEILPRIGVTYAMGAERKTLLRGSYAAFSDGLGNALVEEMNPTGFSFGIYAGQDLNGNHILEPSEPKEFLTPVGFTPGGNPNVAVHSIDPDLEAVVTQELTLGIEHAFLPEFVAGATLTYRKADDYYHQQELWEDPSGVVRPIRASDYYLERTRTGILPNGDPFSAPVYSVKPGFTDTGAIFLTNSDRSHTYKGLTLSATKRLSNKWMLRGHFTFYDWEWDIGRGFLDLDDPTDVLNENDENHEYTNDDNAIFADLAGGSGNVDVFLNSTWSFNVAGLYQLPMGFNVAANINGREGYPVPFYLRSSRTNGGTVSVQASEVDAFRVDDLYTIDARVDKEFTIGDFGFTVSVDIFNLLNEGTVLQVENNVGAGRGGFVDQILSPRIARVGVRLHFR